jgi:hypothetical protein
MIFLRAMGNDILAQCRRRTTRYYTPYNFLNQVQLIGVEGLKSTTTASSSSSSGGDLLCTQLIQLQKEVVQVLAREKLSKEERVLVVMKKVVEVLNTYFVQNPIEKRSNELTMPALGIRLKRRGRRGVVVSGVRRRLLAACPTIYTADHDNLKDTDGWNVWSASCKMTSTSTVASEKTAVKIKKSSSMPGELVIDRGATSGSSSRHFHVIGALEMEDVTLKGGHAVSSFCSLCIVVKYSFFDRDPVILCD